jgi:hypothetical protein
MVQEGREGYLIKPLPSVTLFAVDISERPVRYPEYHVVGSQAVVPFDRFYGMPERIPPVPQGFFMVMPDVACNKIVGEWFKGLQEQSPVSGIPDIKFNEPVIVVIPVGEKKSKNRKMAVMEYAKSFNPRIGEA